MLPPARMAQANGRAIAFLQSRASRCGKACLKTIIGGDQNRDREKSPAFCILTVNCPKKQLTKFRLRTQASQASGCWRKGLLAELHRRRAATELVEPDREISPAVGVWME